MAELAAGVLAVDFMCREVPQVKQSGTLVADKSIFLALVRLRDRFSPLLVSLRR